MPFDTPEPDLTDDQLETELAQTQEKLEAGTLGEDPNAAAEEAGGGEEAVKLSIKQRLKSLPPAKQSTWADVWHVPALLMGLGLFAVGLHQVWPEPVEDNFHAALDQVEELLENRKLDLAEQELNNVGLQLERASDDVKGRFYEIDADRAYLSLDDTSVGQALTDVGHRNRKAILDLYDKAEEAYDAFALDNEDEDAKTALDDQSLHFKARILVSRGERAEALEMLDELSATEPRRRYSLVRSLIDQERSKPSGGDPREVLSLLGRFEAELQPEKANDKNRFIDQMIWLYRTEAEIRLAAKETDRAIDELMIGIQRLRSWQADPEKEAPLLADIGKIYLADGDYEQAEINLMSGQKRLAPGHPLNAEILVALGDIYLAKPGGGVEDAQGLYKQVVANFKGEKAYIDGLVGLADTQARSPDDPRQWVLSVDHFGEAVEMLHERVDLSEMAWSTQHQNAAERIQTHAEFLMTAEQYERALGYLSILRRLYGPELMPSDVLLWLADSHHALAEELRGLAEQLDPQNPSVGLLPSDVVEMQGQRRREAAIHYEDAAGNYVTYAHKMSGVDDDAHGTGLWKGAVSFDYAQLPQRAIDTYAEFVSSRQADPRVAEAKNRLGRAYMALGDYQAAVDQFEDIKEQFPKSTWAVDGLIPQARSYARMDKLDEAERLCSPITHPSGRSLKSTKRRLLHWARFTTPGARTSPVIMKKRSAI